MEAEKETVCPGCGEILEFHFWECPKCKADLRKYLKDCPHCKKGLNILHLKADPRRKFCCHCGNNIESILQ